MHTLRKLPTTRPKAAKTIVTTGGGSSFTAAPPPSSAAAAAATWGRATTAPRSSRYGAPGRVSDGAADVSGTDHLVPVRRRPALTRREGRDHARERVHLIHGVELLEAAIGLVAEPVVAGAAQDLLPQQPRRVAVPALGQRHRGERLPSTWAHPAGASAFGTTRRRRHSPGTTSSGRSRSSWCNCQSSGCARSPFSSSADRQIGPARPARRRLGEEERAELVGHVEVADRATSSDRAAGRAGRSCLIGRRPSLVSP